MVAFRAGRTAAGLGALAIASALLIAGPLSQPSQAVTVTVNTAAEFFAQIDAANLSTDPRVIVFGADVDFDGEDTAVLTADADVTIDGAGHEIFCGGTVYTCGMWLDVNLAGDHTFTLRNAEIHDFRARALRVTDTETAIDGVTFRENSLELGPGPDVDTYADGGALYVENTGTEHRTTITDSVFANNWSRHLDGVGQGGAATIYGYVTVERSTFLENAAEGPSAAGGALKLGWFTSPPDLATQQKSYVHDVTFTANAAISDTWSRAGALDLVGLAMDLENVVFTSNHADSWDSPDAGDHEAGAVYAGFAKVGMFGVIFTDNWANGAGGAITVTSELDIDGATFDSNTAYRGGAIAAIDGASLEVANAYFGGNEALSTVGGAITADMAYSLTVRKTQFLGNEAPLGGGALSVIDTVATVTQSSFVGNASELGAAVYVDLNAVLDLSASTLAGNTGVYGAAVYGGGDAVAIISSVTVVGNGPAQLADVSPDTAQIGGAQVTVSIARSVIVDPTFGANCLVALEIDSDGDNRADDASCDFELGSDLESANFDPMLAALAFNGANTLSMHPLPGSPLLDAYTTDCDPLDEDQRGVQRGINGACDIGSIESMELIVVYVPVEEWVVEVAVENAEDVDVDWIDVDDLTVPPPAGIAFPYGAKSIVIDVPENGWTVTVRLTTPGPTNSLWKLIDGAWNQYSGTLSPNGRTWTITLQDGGMGDTDGVANGEIVDPIAAGVAAAFTG